MIKIKEINKENNNNYFIVYTIKHNIHTVGGTAEEIIEYFSEYVKDKNEQ
jgi:hypothetical protein